MLAYVSIIEGLFFKSGNVQGRCLTRHLLYKLIKYTSSVGQPTQGWNNTPASTSVTCADDVVRLNQQPLITELTFSSYKTICRSIFLVTYFLTNSLCMIMHS